MRKPLRSLAFAGTLAFVPGIAAPDATAAAAALSAAALPAAALPDIVTPGTRSIQIVTRVDLGPLADKVRLAYQVKEGDTLSAIARDLLGSEKRVPDLVAANPGIEPNRLKIGQMLWLPARDAAVKDAPSLLVSMPPNPNVGMPVRHGEPLPHSRYGGHTLLVVPADLLADAMHKDAKVRAKALASPQVQRLVADGSSGWVRDASPIHRAEVTVEIVTGEDGKPAVRTRTTWFGADGKALPVDEHGRVQEPAPKEGALLVLLALVGGGFLVWRLRGRTSQLALA